MALRSLLASPSLLRAQPVSPQTPKLPRWISVSCSSSHSFELRFMLTWASPREHVDTDTRSACVSDDPTNPIGTEYIITRHAGGVQLHHQWPSMNSHQRMLVTKALGFMCKDMAALEFPAYGCIYFDNVNLPQSSLIPISGGKSIGPHCGNRYWSVAPGDPRTYARRPPNQGPWTTHAEYLRALTDAGDSRIPTSTDTRNLEFKGTVDQHLHLHRASEEILLSLAQTEPLQSTCTPTLLHHDMHKRNIFVSEQDPSQITALIDWQSSAVEPSHAYSDEMPDLCQKPEDWDDAELKDPLNDEQRKKVNELSILQRTWEVIVRAYMPEIYRARAMDQDFLRVAQYASSAWRHGAVPVREDLIQLSRRWSGELGLSGPCPYQPTTEEIEMQKRLWPQFRDNLDLRKMLYKGLRTDEAGWVPIDRWEDTRIAHKTLFDEWYHHVVESGEFTEEQARMAWPYDIP